MTALPLNRWSSLSSGALIIAPSVLLLVVFMSFLEFDDLLRRWWAPSAIALATLEVAGAVELRYRRTAGTSLLVATGVGFIVSAFVSFYLPFICGGPIK